ncbi:MAG: hypothetical protein PHX07_05500 [Candidatus Marinimicrobia bacterium]|nr:hypothetical protein [Candidatus Neomarinimicrobiota bacterium]MDX9778474.1 hypothetical protein [bacterium]
MVFFDQFTESSSYPRHPYKVILEGFSRHPYKVILKGFSRREKTVQPHRGPYGAEQSCHR